MAALKNLHKDHGSKNSKNLYGETTPSGIYVLQKIWIVRTVVHTNGIWRQTTWGICPKGILPRCAWPIRGPATRGKLPPDTVCCHRHRHHIFLLTMFFCFLMMYRISVCADPLTVWGTSRPFL